MAIFLATIKADDSRNPTQIDYVLDFGSAHNEARWRDFCKKNIGKTVRVDKPESKRSLNQNRFLWAYMEIISRETGDDPVSLHEFFKAKLLPPRIIEIKGKSRIPKSLEVPATTTTLSKLAFGEYLDRIAALSGVPIPDPHQLKDFIPNY